MTPEPEAQDWALRRRLEDLVGKIEGKYGDLSGRLEVTRPGVTFKEIGGLERAKGAIQGLTYALIAPDIYRQWGITPSKGALLYGPPGTGKTLLAKALASMAGSLFYHLKLMNVTVKSGPRTGELIHDLLEIAPEGGKSVVFLDEVDALCLEHLLAGPAARELSCQIVAQVVERLDEMEPFGPVMVIGATNRADVIDPTLVAPGRLDRLIEVPLPDTAAQREILTIHMEKAETAAGRKLFGEQDWESLIAPMAGMSGAELAEVVRRALEGKVQLAGTGADPGTVTTADLLREVDGYRRIKVVVEKIRYGQYL